MLMAVHHMVAVVCQTFVAVCQMFAMAVHTCWLIGHRKSSIEPMDPIHIYYVILVLSL